MADTVDGLATAPAVREPVPTLFPTTGAGSSAGVGPLVAADGGNVRPHGSRAEKTEKKVSPDPFYRTDRYRLVTPYSLARDPSLA